MEMKNIKLTLGYAIRIYSGGCLGSFDSLCRLFSSDIHIIHENMNFNIKSPYKIAEQLGVRFDTFEYSFSKDSEVEFIISGLDEEYATSILRKALSASSRDLTEIWNEVYKNKINAGEYIGSEVTIVNKLGLHARASARLCRLTHKFDAEVILKRGEQLVSSKDIMEIMMLAASLGTKINIIALGAHKKSAFDTIKYLIDDKLGEAE